MRILVGLVLVVLVAAGGAYLWAISPAEIAPRRAAEPASFEPEVVARGRDLALIGNCADCHTVEGGEPYAGGYAMKTPLGTIYASNITPDPETGIGRWSEEAFRRAMREGLDREGRHLYPAFPYNHFTLMSDADIGALYAFMMTRRPVANEKPDNELAFPFEFRPLLAGWKLLFFDDERFQAGPGEDETLAHGRYLVDGLAHCGACHTPRNALMAEKDDEYLQGGAAQDWYGPGLTEASLDSATPWTRDRLIAYLTEQWADDHGVAAGPMRDVAHNLAQAPRGDVEAIAGYVAQLMGAPESVEANATAPAPTHAAASDMASARRALADNAISAEAGAAIYADACARCHESGAGADRLEQGLRLAFSTAVRADRPDNFLQIVAHGIQPGEGQAGHFMPGFAGALTDAQMESLALYVRQTFSAREAWKDVSGRIDDIARVRDARAASGS